MKTKSLGTIIIIIMLLALFPVGNASAAVEKVDVCHLDDMGMFHNISDNAFDSHVAHGDAAPGDWIPGKTGYKFLATCTPVLDVTGTWTGYSGAKGNLVYYFTMSLAQDSNGVVTGSIFYPDYNGGTTRTVSGTLSGSLLEITTAGGGYSATVKGTVTGTHFYGEGTDSSSVTVALTADR